MCWAQNVASQLLLKHARSTFADMCEHKCGGPTVAETRADQSGGPIVDHARPMVVDMRQHNSRPTVAETRAHKHGRPTVARTRELHCCGHV